MISFNTLVAAVFTESQVCPSYGRLPSPRPQHNGVGVKHLDVFPGKQMNDNRIPKAGLVHGCLFLIWVCIYIYICIYIPPKNDGLEDKK